MNDIKEVGSDISPSMVEKVRHLETSMLGMPQLEVRSEYIQGGKVGAKTVYFAAGTTVTGGMHRFENMNCLHYGELLLVGEGDPVRFIADEGPVFIVSPAGVKRAAYVVKDSCWTSFHATEEKDVDKLHDEVIVPTELELEFTNNLMIG